MKATTNWVEGPIYDDNCQHLGDIIIANTYDEIVVAINPVANESIRITVRVHQKTMQLRVSNPDNGETLFQYRMGGEK